MRMSSLGFEMLNRFYQILKRTILGEILCHGLVLDVGCGEGSFPKKEKIVGLDVDKQRLKRCSYEFKVLGDACLLPLRGNLQCHHRNGLSTVHRRLEERIKGNVKGWQKSVLG